MDNRIDFAALAALRPGEAREALVAALGSRWRPPAPHEEGRVKAIARAHGFLAQLDVAGHLASLLYTEPFPADVEILGLHMGMSPEAALAVLPQLTFSRRMDAHDAAFYSTALSDQYRMGAQFRWGKLYQVSIFAPGAVYPAKRPMAYPAPAGKPGDPFADPNFKLVVLSALIEAEAIDLAEPKDLAELVLRRPVDLEEDGYRFIGEAYDYLVRYPLTDAELAQVETLAFDGGNAIYRYCFYFWDGESKEFDVKSIAGIARCGDVRVFNCIAMLDAIDADHLAGLSQLEDISLPSECRHPERLLELPALKRLSFFRPTIRDPALIAKLKQRGVAVTIHG
jgi:hypothetical protein